MVFRNGAEMGMIKKLFAAYLPQIIIIALVVLAGLAAWQWVSSIGYRAQAAALKLELLEVQGELALQTANNSVLRAQIQRQSDAVDAAAREAARVRAEALRARDAALADLEDAQADYARLREDWPQDAVQAVLRVREELEL